MGKYFPRLSRNVFGWEDCSTNQQRHEFVNDRFGAVVVDQRSFSRGITASAHWTVFGRPLELAGHA